ncbi:MAG: hypothetical protein ACLFVU_12425 [Phycisphaerae bacterium]
MHGRWVPDVESWTDRAQALAIRLSLQPADPPYADWNYTLPSAVFAFLSAGMVWWLGLRWGGSTAAWLAGSFWATMPMNWFFCFSASPMMLGQLLMLLLLCLLELLVFARLRRYRSDESAVGGRVRRGLEWALKATFVLLLVTGLVAVFFLLQIAAETEDAGILAIVLGSAFPVWLLAVLFPLLTSREQWFAPGAPVSNGLAVAIPVLPAVWFFPSTVFWAGVLPFLLAPLLAGVGAAKLVDRHMVDKQARRPLLVVLQTAFFLPAAALVVLLNLFWIRYEPSTAPVEDLPTMPLDWPIATALGALRMVAPFLLGLCVWSWIRKKPGAMAMAFCVAMVGFSFVWLNVLSEEAQTADRSEMRLFARDSHDFIGGRPYAAMQPSPVELYLGRLPKRFESLEQLNEMENRPEWLIVSDQDLLDLGAYKRLPANAPGIKNFYAYHEERYLTKPWELGQVQAGSYYITTGQVGNMYLIRLSEGKITTSTQPASFGYGREMAWD